MVERSPSTAGTGSKTATPPVPYPSAKALRWLIGVRLVVISALFLGILLIQVSSQKILPLRNYYGLILFSFGLSLLYLILYARRVSPRVQTWIQLVGDIAVITGIVYFTGGLYSPFSFLYLTVIAVAAMLMRGGGLIFAGLSAIAYGLLVDLMVFEVLPVSESLTGIQIAVPTSRILVTLLTNVVGFLLVAVLVSYLGESLRSAHHRLQEETERTKQFVALTDHVVRSVGAGIIACDLESRVLHLNPAGARMLEIADEESVTGSLLDDVIPLEGQSWGLLKTRVRDRNVVRLEGSVATTGMRLGMTIGPLADEHTNQRMQERMAAVGELAARMAHEIKNPLASISGSAQVLESAGTLDEKDQRLLRILIDESRRLSGILDGFLEYTRPQRAAFGPCNVSAMLRDCVDLLGRSEEHRDDHRLVLRVPENLTLRGEEHQLRQIIWNLSRNALQAMPEGGELEISAVRRNGRVVLRWRDTGVGMTEEVRRQAFEPFVTTRPGGTGLGLAVVYAAVAEHGGTIAIDSTLGGGTVVTVELPAEKVAV